MYLKLLAEPTIMAALFVKYNVKLVILATKVVTMPHLSLALNSYLHMYTPVVTYIGVPTKLILCNILMRQSFFFLVRVCFKNLTYFLNELFCQL